MILNTLTSLKQEKHWQSKLGEARSSVNERINRKSGARNEKLFCDEKHVSGHNAF